MGVYKMATPSQAIITGVEVLAIRLPMEKEHKTASGIVSESPLVLTTIYTNTGITGHSIVFTYTPIALKPVADLVMNMSPLIEKQVLAPIALEQQLSSRFRLLGSQGLVGMALAAIDMALWDAHAKLHDCNLVQLLGGAQKTIPVYGAIGFEGEKGSAETATQLAQAGFRGVKAKVGYPDIKEELRVVSAIRNAVGPTIDIMLDYNQCLTPTEAIERTKRFNDAEITWIEEPTLAHDYKGHSVVKNTSSIPIQCGENWWNTLDLQHALDADASDFVMLDVMKIGGVSGWLRAATICASHQKLVSTHLWPEVSAQLLCLTPTAHWLEYCDWWNPLLKEPLQIENGLAKVGSNTGLGMDWDDDVAAQFSIN